ncbi:MAG: hypothetical protein K9L76_00665 [Candidatus Omnitrophica bacterium]|nr:hypothetical protein [Candidatus Omnitrophota bacterium]
MYLKKEDFSRRRGNIQGSFLVFSEGEGKRSKKATEIENCSLTTALAEGGDSNLN